MYYDWGPLPGRVVRVGVPGQGGSRAFKVRKDQNQADLCSTKFPGQNVPLSWLCGWAETLVEGTTWALQLGTWSSLIQVLVEAPPVSPSQSDSRWSNPIDFPLTPMGWDQSRDSQEVTPNDGGARCPPHTIFFHCRNYQGRSLSMVLCQPGGGAMCLLSLSEVKTIWKPGPINWGELLVIHCDEVGISDSMTWRLILSSSTTKLLRITVLEVF